ncbi:glycosyltransferase family 87 protein [Microbacterium sulfonylureivorans]|uniref:glycosyltransferase family 87 protein n=1 Tax=Microbacterium sulfonylureivorans TaxID=2486854 RepID=UPI0013E00990|nr:glycosyltransferase family 87 protein [Microbacterium sulfonylureivorans]
MGTNTRRALTVAAWIVVVAIGVMLSIQRFRDAVGSDIGTDLRTFVAAAEHIRNGRSPYTEFGYVYSPLVAWLLLPFPDFDAAVGPWTAASIAALWGAVAAVTATFWRALSWWQRPVLAGVGIVTALYSALLSLDLWLGQTDTFLPLVAALAVFFASRNRQIASGVSLAFGAIIKSWPVGLGLWMFRRGVQQRGRLIAATVGTGAAFLLLALVIHGPQMFSEWIDRTLVLSEQDLVAYSVWGAGRHLFTQSAALEPLFVAPIVGTIVSWTLAAFIVALIVITLRRPGDDALSMWNIATAVVLLIPVCHLWYFVLALPLLWTWVAHALKGTRRLESLIAVAVMAVWWVIVFRLPPLDNQFGESTPQYIAVVGSSLVALTLSVVLSARRDADRAVVVREAVPA